MGLEPVGSAHAPVASPASHELIFYQIGATCGRWRFAKSRSMVDGISLVFEFRCPFHGQAI